MTAGRTSARHQRARLRQLRVTQLPGASVGVDGGERRLPGAECAQRQVIGGPCYCHAAEHGDESEKLPTAVNIQRREFRTRLAASAPTILPALASAGTVFCFDGGKIVSITLKNLPPILKEFLSFWQQVYVIVQKI
jgi:hypothetical protein